MSNVNCYFHSEIQTMIDMQRFKKQYQKWNPRTKIDNGLTTVMYSKGPNEKWSYDTCQIDSLFELMDIKSDGPSQIQGISPCTLETAAVSSYSCSPPPGRGRLVEPTPPQESDKSGKKLKKLWHMFRKTTKEYYQHQLNVDYDSLTQPRVITAYQGPSDSAAAGAVCPPPTRPTAHAPEKTYRQRRASYYKDRFRGDVNSTY